MAKLPAKTRAVLRSVRPRARGRRPPSLPHHIESRQLRLAATIGAAAKQARERAGLTQAEVADAIGTATEVYGRMERGALMPSVPTLMRLCLTLGCGPQELMGFSALAPPHSAPMPRPVPPGLTDTPQKRRLLQHLACLNPPRLKVVSRLVTFLQCSRPS